MDKLTLEHLAPYLPYGLKFVFDNRSYWADSGLTYTGERYDLGELIRLTTSTENVIGINWNDGKNGLSMLAGLDSSYHKPILRPLSDLDGSDLMKKWRKEHDIIMSNDRMLLNLKGATLINILEFPMNFLTGLIKEHFDVFGLIAAGLAVDMNTLEGGAGE